MSTEMGILTDIIRQLTDVILPQRCILCGEPRCIVCEPCLDKLEPASCGQLPENTFAIYSYADPYVRNLIRTLKYRRAFSLTKPIAKATFDRILEEIHDAGVFGGKNADEKFALVPVPSDPQRLQRRGFNQSEELARAIMEVGGASMFSLESSALKKKSSTESQTKLKNKALRENNLVGKFEAQGSIVKNRVCIIVDDVITTGATTKDCARALREAGAKSVFILAIAH